MTSEFTPFSSLFGGMIIGLAAVVLMATNGRIAGISGIVSRLLPPTPATESQDKTNYFTAIAFVAGLLLAVPLTKVITGSLPAQTMVASVPVLILAGLLVGFGSGYGSGCTSGHGVCGISRFSNRSIIATITFMVTAAITVYVIRHVLGASL